MNLDRSKTKNELGVSNFKFISSCHSNTVVARWTKDSWVKRKVDYLASTSTWSHNWINNLKSMVKISRIWPVLGLLTGNPALTRSPGPLPVTDGNRLGVGGGLPLPCHPRPRFGLPRRLFIPGSPFVWLFGSFLVDSVPDSSLSFRCMFPFLRFSEK